MARQSLPNVGAFCCFTDDKGHQFYDRVIDIRVDSNGRYQYQASRGITTFKCQPLAKYRHQLEEIASA